MDLFDRIDELPEQDRQAFLAWTEQVIIREKALEYPGPAEFAASVDPRYKVTPALKVISAAVERTITTRSGRLIISCPPQDTGKTTLAVWAVIRILQRNPDHRVMYLSYSHDLAEKASLEARQILSRYGSGGRDPLTGISTPDRLGIGLSDEKAAASNWRVRGHRGGMIATGIGGTITGKDPDVIIIDDALKGMQAADSPAEKRKVIAGFQGDVKTRGPSAPIIVIGTRWAEDDLSGWLLSTEKGKWEHLNIPAVAEHGIPDAMGRPLGEWMESVKGRTVEEWEEFQAEYLTNPIGRRVWSALYQGSPMPSEGGLFKQEWFNNSRLGVEPVLYRRIVAVDPAETGRGDEAGVVAAGLTQTGAVALTEDWSGYFTSEQWSRKAVLLALTTGATELVFEAYSAATTYRRVIANAYKDVVAAAAVNEGRVVDGVVVPDQLDPERPPFRIEPWVGSGNAYVRSTGLRSACASGRCRVVGFKLATLEYQAIHWLEGQHQPDRVAAATIAYDHLAGAGNSNLAAPNGGTWGSLPTGLGTSAGMSDRMMG